MPHAGALSRSSCRGAEKTEACDALKILAMTAESSSSWIVTAQALDPQVRAIKDFLGGDQTTQKPEQNLYDYELGDGVIFLKVGIGNTAKRLWVVLKPLRWQVVRRCHDNIGDFSINAMLKKLQAKYWFECRKRYVRQYISVCMECLYR